MNFFGLNTKEVSILAVFSGENMKYIILKIIRFYQRSLSPMLNSFLPLTSACRYNPTCSEYTYQAVNKYEAIRGLFLGTKRILSCNPFGGHGNKPLT